VALESIARVRSNGASPVGWGRLPADNADWAVFLQNRLQSYATILFTISLGFFCISALIVALTVSPRAALILFSLPQCHAHFAATGAMALLWLATRFGARSLPVLRALDAGATFVVCLFFTGMYVGVPPASRPELVLLLSMNFVLVSRAATVPSTPLRTLLIGLVSVIPTIVVSAMLQAGSNVATAATTSAAAYAATWAGVALVTSSMISRVIYGLSRQVAEARQVGQYTLEERIGRGGMGEVFRARHALLRRPTAVKLLRPDNVAPANLVRFEREVQLTSQLRHPNTVAIYDYGRTMDGIFYYAMEFLDGIDLNELVELAGPQRPERVVRILRQACGALQEAHAAGLVHRDVKPANIILCEAHGSHDVAKVVDFGLVKEFRAGETASVTQAATLLGTPLFMAPETLLSADDAKPSSDIYSLGGVAYYLLTGSHVFMGDTTLAICTQHLHAVPEAPSLRLGSSLPAGLDELVLECLAKDPGQRPTSAARLAHALAALGLAEWTEAEAQDWWGRQRTRIATFRATRKRKLDVETGATIAINLTNRGGAREMRAHADAL